MSVAERFLSPLQARASWLPVFVTLGISLFAWSAIGLGPFSGFNTPPDYGDFEAQRHWMEITNHLSPKEWYIHDFYWWRLDYPPLTAYHSWLCGYLGSKLNPQWFALDSSRGLETPELKAFMRSTVIASQMLVYAPSMWVWIVSCIPASDRENGQIEPVTSQRVKFLGIALLFPCLSIIDHGHFQFNSVMLGFTVASQNCLVKRRFVLASIFFVLALFFKQMALYYAPAIFCAILGCCFGPEVQWQFQFKRFFSVAFTVVVSTAILMAPFFQFEQAVQIVQRVFPVFRGLWEDKVANLWCTLNYTVFKLKMRFTAQQLQFLALATTLVGISPSCVCAFVGKPRLWPWTFASCAWAFFLFSFQVHEKSVLLPLLPTILVSIQQHSLPNVLAMSQWIGNIAYFSMWPLLKREQLGLQYFTLLALYNYLFSTYSTTVPRNWLNKLAVAGSYSFFVTLFLAEAFGLIPIEITTKYPDFLIVGNMVASFGCFIYFWLWQTWYMLTLTTLSEFPNTASE